MLPYDLLGRQGDYIEITVFLYLRFKLVLKSDIVKNVRFDF